MNMCGNMEISCGFVILNVDETVLIAHPTNDYAGRGVWTFPKGCLENTETRLECALREVKEETNLDLKVIKGKISYLGNSIKNNREVALYLFKAFEDITKYEIKCNSLVDCGGDDDFFEMDDFKWVSIEDSLNYLSIREQYMVEEHLISKL